LKARRQLLAGLAFLASLVSVTFWTLVARVRLWALGARVGRGLRVRGFLHLHCHRSGAIRIGNGCRIQSGFSGNPVGGFTPMALWVGPGGMLTIGNDVGLSNATIVCLHAVSIEDEAFVGGGSRIYDTDFHPIDPEDRLKTPGGGRGRPVRVGRRSFVGAHSLLLKGAMVGATAVVGAGSVVRGRIPAGEVWTGNPARYQRTLRLEATA
jgi:acetyltransferase-like isoleucine patch superfamily enzyme